MFGSYDLGNWQPAQGVQPGLDEVFWASLAQQRQVENAWAQLKLQEEAYDRRNDAIFRETGVKLFNPSRAMQLTGLSGPESTYRPGPDESPQRYMQRLRELEEQFPHAYGTIQAHRSPTFDALEMKRGAEAELSGLMVRSQGMTPYLASFAGSFVGSFYDPTGIVANIIGLPGNPSRAILWNAMRQGAVNAGVQTAVEPLVQAWRKEAGLRYGLSESAQNVAMAFAFGFTIDAAGRTIWRGGKAGIQRLRQQPKTAAEALGKPADGQAPAAVAEPLAGAETAAGAAATALDEAAKRLPRGNPIRQAADGDDAALVHTVRKMGLDQDDSVRGAAAEVELELERGRQLPPLDVDDGSHELAMAQALRNAVNPNEPPAPRVEPIPKQRTPELADDRPAPAAIGTRFEVEGKPVAFRTINPANVATDPRTFQFKGGGDAASATDRLTGVKRWDPIAAGRAVIYERASGELVVADGHQRLGLAQRLQGEGQTVELQAFVFREKDGWTPGDVRALAAKKNLQEGSGTSIDAARIIRERPDIIDQSVPLTSAAMRQARSLSRLSDEAFGQVLGGVVDPSYAAMVGDLVPDKTRHAGMLKDMADYGPRDQTEARLLIGQLLQTGAHTETQLTLLGVETTQRSLLSHKVRVLTDALKLLKRDRAIFNLLDREAGRIEGAGNVLAEEANAARAAEAGRLAEVIERLAEQRGRVADMLNEAAVAVAEGLPPKRGAEAFAARVRRILEEEGLQGLVGGEARPREDLAPPGKAFDEPNGVEAQAQTKQLDAEFGKGLKADEEADRQGSMFALPEGGEQPAPLRGIHSTRFDFDRFVAAPKRDPGYWGAGVYMFPYEYVQGRFTIHGAGTFYGMVEEGSRNIPLLVEARKPFHIETEGVGLGKARADWGALKAHGWSHEGAPVHVWGDAKDPAKLVDAARLKVRRQDAETAKRTLDDTSNRVFEIEDEARRRFGKLPAIVDPEDIEKIAKRQAKPRRAEAQRMAKELREARDVAKAAHEASELAFRRASPEFLLAEQFSDALLKAGYDAVVISKSGRPYEIVAIKPGTVRGMHTGRPMFGLSDGGYAFTPRAAEQLPEIRAEIDKVIARLPKGVRLELAERLVYRGEEIEGRTDVHDGLVFVSLRAGDPGRTARHEEVHVLRGLNLFDADEWRLLVDRAGKLGLRDKYKIDERYKPAYERRFKDEPAKLEEALIEETVAHMIADWEAGARFGGTLDRVIQRVVDLLRAVRDALRIKGFHTADDVFRSIESGEIGRRPQPADDFVRGDALRAVEFDPDAIATALYAAAQRLKDHATLIEACKS